jgi:nitric oxide dioxygenase
MFRDNPEVKALFNPANQSFGAGKTRASQIEAFSDQVFAPAAAPGSQQMSLAQAVLAYASHIDNLAALTPAVARISHKHASLDIRPEHYPIVGQHFLRAIKEVLGDAATPAIIEAWAAAYGFLAALLIETENRLRAESGSKVGGWAGFQPFVVAQKRRESAEVYSFYLTPQAGGPVPLYEAGQYLCFRLDIPQVGLVYRNYSLSAGPGGEHLRVSIKREPGVRDLPAGICSNYFHTHVNAGDVLDVAPPYGSFTLVESALPPVFIAAGIGITPMFSMFQAARRAHPLQPVHFIQCMRNGRLHPLKAEVAEVARLGAGGTVHSVYSQPEASDRLGVDYDTVGHLSLELLQAIVPDPHREFYFTGPIKFMRHVRTALHQWGVPARHVHYECFGPHAAEIEADIP